MNTKLDRCTRRYTILYTFAATATLLPSVCLCVFSLDCCYVCVYACVCIFAPLWIYYTPKLSTDYAIKLRATDRRVCMYAFMPNNGPKRDRRYNKACTSPQTHTLIKFAYSVCLLSFVGCRVCVEVNRWSFTILCLFSLYRVVSLLPIQLLYFSYNRTGCCSTRYGVHTVPHRYTPDWNRVRERVNVWITSSIYIITLHREVQYFWSVFSF